MKSKLSIISLLVIVTSIFAQDYQVVNSSSNTILIEVTPKYTVDTLEIDNQEYLRINFSNSFVNSEDFGKPDIRYSILPIGVRNEFGNTFRVVSTNYKFLKGKISPVPFIKKSGDFYQNEFKITDEYKVENQELILPGKFGYTRNLPVQDLKIFPIQFDQENYSIKIYERIVIEVKLANQNLSSPIKYIDDLASSSVINSDQVNEWAKEINLAKTASTSVPSVLSSGTWYKFPITEEGIYKIDAATLSAIGISTNGLDPRTIKIYNNGGKILPWAIDEARPNDLQELAIKVEGESDGVFNENDFILFYGRGVNFWDYNNSSNKIKRNKNWYSRENYFWLTFGGNTGKRISTVQSESSSNPIVQTSTKAFVFNDEDNLNVIKSGVVYVSDEYSSAKQSYTYINPIMDHVSGTTAYYNYSFANVGETNVPFSLEENGQRILTTTLSRPFEQYQPGILLTGSASFNGNFTDNRSVLKILFAPTNLVSKGYLDFFEIEFERNLKAIEDELVFFSKDTNGIIDYRLSNFSTSANQVFDVTDYNNTKLISPEFISGGEIRFKKSQTSGNVSKFYAANSSKYKVPSGFENILNSFVRAESEGVEYIIITHRELRSAAEKLINHRSVVSDFPLTSRIFYTDDKLL